LNLDKNTGVYNYLNMTSANNMPQTVPSNNQTEVQKGSQYVPEKDLFAWTAKSRPFKKRPREYWVTIVAIASLLSFILFLAEGTMPVILIIAVLFLYFVMSTVEPHDLSFKITDKGIRVGDRLTEWNQLTRYWFTKRLDVTTLNFETIAFPGRLEVVIQEKDMVKMRTLLSKYLPEEEPEKTSVDKASDWVSKKILRI
jgi:hypothetical protein